MGSTTSWQPLPQRGQGTLSGSPSERRPGYTMFVTPICLTSAELRAARSEKNHLAFCNNTASSEPPVARRWLQTSLSSKTKTVSALSPQPSLILFALLSGLWLVCLMIFRVVVRTSMWGVQQSLHIRQQSLAWHSTRRLFSSETRDHPSVRELQTLCQASQAP